MRALQAGHTTLDLEELLLVSVVGTEVQAHPAEAKDSILNAGGSLDLSIARGTGDEAILSWPAPVAQADFKVLRNEAPYFDPLDPGTFDLTALCVEEGSTVSCSDSGALGSPDLHRFYLVSIYDLHGQMLDEDRMGVINLALVPGIP